MLCESFQQIKEQLNTDNVVVKDAQGDGRHVRFENEMIFFLVLLNNVIIAIFVATGKDLNP